VRSGRSLLLLVLVAAGLGGYVYFVELPRDIASSTLPDREKVFTLAAGTVEEVEITNATSQVTRLTRQDNTWMMVAPESADADAAEVGSLVSSLESLERVKVIDENPASAAPFGLEAPRIRVSFKTVGETTPKVLLIGNKTPTGGDLYARVEGAPAIFLIGAYLENTFDRAPFDLRDKTVLQFDRAAVNAITITQGTRNLTLTRTGTEWRLTTPIDARADGAAVDALISQVSQARMTSLSSSDAATTLREYSLDKPQALVTISAGSAKAELAIGKAEDDTHLFARDLSRPLVFSVDKTLLDELTKKADDFRVKDVFAYRSFSALGMDVTFGGTTYTFAKTKDEGENSLEHWTQTAPVPAADHKFDENKFDDFLMTMSNLRAESFDATAASAGQTVTITARFGDAGNPQTETVTLRRTGSIVQAVRAGEPGAAVVSTTDFDRAMGLLREITGAK
jgi:hypothetical protein